MTRGGLTFTLALFGLLPISCGPGLRRTGPPILFGTNIVNPSDVNAVSKFYSCSGHPYPEQNSPNSQKNYFWPNSTNFNTSSSIAIYAACDGTINQTNDDTNDTSGSSGTTRGMTVHLFCDNTSTALRYFHLNPTGQIGGHYSAGNQIGYADVFGGGSVIWQNSSNFDVAVSDDNDNSTVDYFLKLNVSAWQAWSPRGLTDITQTWVSAPITCPSFNALVTDSVNIYSFSPALFKATDSGIPAFWSSIVRVLA